MTDNEVTVVRDALEDALHALVTNQGLHATDRPDLVGKRPFEDISWPIDEDRAIRSVEEALSALGGHTARGGRGPTTPTE